MTASGALPRRARLRSLAGLGAVALICTLLAMLATKNLSLLSRVDLFVQDWETASVFAPREAQDPRIVIVAVDEATLSGLRYRSPVDRQFLATLIRNIAAHHPAVI